MIFREAKATCKYTICTIEFAIFFDVFKKRDIKVFEMKISWISKTFNTGNLSRKENDHISI